MNERSLTKQFCYLDMLRESGATNMWSAGAYLMRDLGMKRDDAVAVLGLWMKTFDGKADLKSRVAQAISLALTP